MSKDTQFKPGNQLWKLRSPENIGRPKKFEKPVDMWNKAAKYFEWCEENPHKEGRIVQDQGKAVLKALPKMRAFTLDGLHIYLNISDTCWLDYTKNPDFSGVTSEIIKIIKEQKFTGAASGLLNPNIIARDLGLSDKLEAKVDSENTNKNFNMNVEIDFDELDEEDRELVERLLSRHEADED